MTARAKQSGLAPAKSSLPGLRAELIINRRKTGISIERDAVHSAMWRVRRSGEPPSDMVNLSRATDAAIAWARPRGLGGTETANWHWDIRESAPVTPPMRYSRRRYLDSPQRPARCTGLLPHDLGAVAGQHGGDAVSGGYRLWHSVGRERGCTAANKGGRVGVSPGAASDSP